jgi:hypothetical protein
MPEVANRLEIEVDRYVNAVARAIDNQLRELSEI